MFETYFRYNRYNSYLLIIKFIINNANIKFFINIEDIFNLIDISKNKKLIINDNNDKHVKIEIEHV